MKKILSIFICLILAFTMTACGGTAPDTSNASNTSNNTNGDASASNTSDTISDGQNNSVEISDTPENDSGIAEDTTVIGFSPVTAVDNDQCSITITDIDAENMWGYTLKATLENKSSDITYMFSVYSASINGVTCDPFFASEVAPGKKSIEEISFSTETLEENGITDFTDIELTFRVSDYDDWSAAPVADETVHVYPYGEDKATVFVRDAQATDTVLADNEYATIIVTGYYTDDIWGYTADLYIVNKTDTEIMISVEDVSVNGFMADPFFATSVMPHKSTFTSISWSEDIFIECGITTVENIEFILAASDYNDWMADRFFEEAITLNP